MELSPHNSVRGLESGEYDKLLAVADELEEQEISSQDAWHEARRESHHQVEKLPQICASLEEFAQANQHEALHFHDLRHEAASRMGEGGMSILWIFAVTCHKSFAMLKRYTHFKTEDIAKELDKTGKG